MEYRPLILDPQHPGDARVLAELRARGDIEFSDLRDLLDREFAELTDPPERVEGPESDRWIYYPWRGRVLGLPGPQTLRAIRLDRNRNKLTRDEQRRLREMSIGVVGQSVGHAVAYTIALEGICGSLRLADFDVLSSCPISIACPRACSISGRTRPWSPRERLPNSIRICRSRSIGAASTRIRWRNSSPGSRWWWRSVIRSISNSSSAKPRAGIAFRW